MMMMIFCLVSLKLMKPSIGGKEKNKHKSKKLNAGRGTVGKSVAFGMREKGEDGEAMAVHVQDAKGATLHEKMLNRVLTGATIHADENSAYGALRDDYEVEQIKSFCRRI